jgi:DNA replication initiation complex subunit (GINS family)
MARDEEVFDYPTLVNKWRRERGATALTKMDAHFYEAFDRHLKQLREDYTREHAANPATPKVLILQDELMNLQRVRDDIYDLREKKIVTSAVIAARGGNPDRGNMTKEEEILFDEILRVLRDARRNLLRRGAPVKEVPRPASGGGPPTPPEPAAEPSGPAAQPASVLAEGGVEAASPEAPLPGSPPPVAHARAPAPETLEAADEPAPPRRMGPSRVLVRMKEPVPSFVAPDLRQYRLAAEDVAALPRDVAHVLIQRGIAHALGA